MLGLLKRSVIFGFVSLIVFVIFSSVAKSNYVPEYPASKAWVDGKFLEYRYTRNRGPFGNTAQIFTDFPASMIPYTAGKIQ